MQARLIAALRDAAPDSAPAARVQVLETHISYVLLTGVHAYKIKKAVRLGFLDFTTLAARKHYCEEELRLNRRHAPALYLDVVPITGTVDRPRISGFGSVLEYAVRMREFGQDALLDNVLARNELTAAHIDRLARTVAQFHETIAVAAANGPFGTPEEILRIALDNFREIRPLVTDAADRASLAALDAWTRREHAAHCAAFAARREEGFVRECHGDLHLRNIALVDGVPTIFDCIEFNERMRWIDVMNELAFTVMDLAHRNRPDLGHRFLDAYLDDCGDYAGVAVLRFYLVYRAMVRAKVACLRIAQLQGGAEGAALWREFREFLRLAAAYTEDPRPGVIVAHGFAGCGKTTLSQRLLERIGVVRIRTDVERKRLHGLAAEASSHSGIAGNLYAEAVTVTTYHYVATLARAVVAGRRTVIVDATFLKRWQRGLFRHLAAELGVAFTILDIVASETTLRERIVRRARVGGDASEADLAVLEHQLRSAEPLAADERADVVVYDGERPLEAAEGRTAWSALRDKLDAEVARPPAVRARGGDPVAGLPSKLAFLVRPESYGEGNSTVEAIETNMSWVFLADRHAYKLKKPTRTAHGDLRDPAARLRSCIDEVRLNRRLTSNVYLGVVPLLRDERGNQAFTGTGAVVDWLVQMRRLPAGAMLDHVIQSGSVASADIEAVVQQLCDFYRRSRPVALDGAEYRREFAAGIAEHRLELERAGYALPMAEIERICEALLAILAQASLFDARAAGRIVEGHGDLRPERICLEREPQIIACVTFSRRLRTLDPADELALLALECERLGAPQVGAQLLAAFRERCADATPAALAFFYRGYRALMRAAHVIRHLEKRLSDRAEWIARAKQYVELAAGDTR